MSSIFCRICDAPTTFDNYLLHWEKIMYIHMCKECKPKIAAFAKKADHCLEHFQPKDSCEFCTCLCKQQKKTPHECVYTCECYCSLCRANERSWEYSVGIR